MSVRSRGTENVILLSIALLIQQRNKKNIIISKKKSIIFSIHCIIYLYLALYKSDLRKCE